MSICGQCNGWIWLPLWALLLSFPSLNGSGQSSKALTENRPDYTLHVPVNEISLTFHAFDDKGAPLTHLTVPDLTLWDSGKRQNRIVMLRSYENLPIRAGFLFDTSASMSGYLNINRSILLMYASRLLRKGVDRAFVMQFEEEPLMRQNWTNNAANIAAGAAAIARRTDRLPLTALFDTLYTTCRDQWVRGDGDVTGNFILLFTDGEDDASHVYLSEAVDMCQRARTAIYAITNMPKSPFSDGQKTLETLAHESGGRVFFHPRGAKIWQDLQMIEAEQRNEYRLVYKPSPFRADGDFHRIRLECSVKGARIMTRSGYYAFARR